MDLEVLESRSCIFHLYLELILVANQVEDQMLLIYLVQIWKMLIK